MILLTNFITALIFWSDARIRLPAEPVLFIFGALFIQTVYHQLQYNKDINKVYENS
jgi:hypothetical protein